ncbi:Partitioning defective 3 -like protein B [Collichthys lucidus]|uniref:Partitioning defective 3-like protein B n=1 Tax=Collichthys lucidus TaxID=240159 RepID=A0A4U5TXF5_COLLU|nr:Partitioning defective 3 -like protein B [Collichthys lucidus]
MKVTVTFGDTGVVVPCKAGWTVRDLIDQAGRRYRRILEQISAPIPMPDSSTKQAESPLPSSSCMCNTESKQSESASPTWTNRDTQPDLRPSTNT